MSGHEYAVELEGIGKSFPGVRANYDITLRVRTGSIHSIVGENGAGKSTLMKTLYGMHQPDEGTIKVFGQETHFRSPTAAIAAGVGMVHQHFMLADNLTVLENIVLGAETSRSFGRLSMSEPRRRITELATSLGVTLDLDAPVSELGIGQRQRVEILKVLYRGARIVILDEPTAVLVPQEVDELFANLRQLVADGATVIFISHKLDEVMAISDEITVIRRGTTVATVTPETTSRRSLAELMVGSELPDPSGRTSTIGDAVLLRIHDVSVAGASKGSKDALEHASLQVRAGEVVGIAGVEGNGQLELCEAILGLRPIVTGQVWLGGADVTKSSVHDRLMTGISYIPFDRHREGLLLDSPLWENTLLGREDEPALGNGPFVNAAAAREDCRAIIDRFSVSTPSERVPAFALSGGNQQKLIVGREMTSKPTVLIAAHPTRGVDVGAQAAIWDELRTARDHGLAILLISADLEELIGLSDTILVMFDGRITATLSPEAVTPELLGSYMTGELQEAL